MSEISNLTKVDSILLVAAAWASIIACVGIYGLAHALDALEAEIQEEHIEIIQYVDQIVEYQCGPR